MSAPAISAGDEPRPSAVGCCRLCHRALDSVQHVRFSAELVSPSGQLVGEDSYAFCWECVRLANGALRALERAADAGQLRGRR